MATECGVAEEKYHSFAVVWQLNEESTLVQNAYGKDEGACEIAN